MAGRGLCSRCKSKPTHHKRQRQERYDQFPSETCPASAAVRPGSTGASGTLTAFDFLTLSADAREREVEVSLGLVEDIFRNSSLGWESGLPLSAGRCIWKSAARTTTSICLFYHLKLPLLRGDRLEDGALQARRLPGR